MVNGAKAVFMRMFPIDLQREVKEEFANFVGGFNEYSYVVALEERSTTSLVRWWICHGANGVQLQNIAIRIL